MKRKILGAGLFCFVLFAAILAGYWDMLSTEKLKIVRDKASQGVGEIADIVRKSDKTMESAAPKTDVTTPEGSPATASASGKEGRAVSISGSPPAETSALPPTQENKALATADQGEAPPPQNATPKALAQEKPSDDKAAVEPQPSLGGAGPAGEDSAASEPAGPLGSMAPPTFDIVRVEPDGSTVLAGRAPAGSSIALLDGQTKIGGDTASPSGDFVVALDQRLEVGEHQLTLQATAPDGRAATSAEVAIVSIPEKGRENELLAMVETPDGPSRLISIPSARENVPNQPAPLATTATLPEPDAADGLSTSSAAAEATLLPSTAPATASPAQDGDAGLRLPLAANRSATSGLPAAALAVEAVEIEGDRIYIAGRASGAASVRAYIDNAFLATAPKVAADRFLITAKAPVVPGDHMVRADALDAAGKVVARVEVPFNRPEGRDMAAISAMAPAEPPHVPAPTQDAGTTGEDPSSAPVQAGPTIAGEQPDAAARVPLQVPEALATPGETASAASPAREATTSAPAPSGADTLMSAAGPGDDIAVIRQPALETVGTRVIIRRGDTLWRISRDTYGKGASYTVIYLANGDQIRDPNRIYPGQVFRMPRSEADGTNQLAMPQ